MRTEKLCGAKLRPLVQLLPALAVAAAVLGTLPRTRPVLAEVPERLDPIAVQAAALPEETTEEEPEEEEALPALPYADGVYTGSSRGFGGRVRVQVTMENGRITDLKLLDASNETPAFLRRAKRLLTTVLTEQTWEVDAESWNASVLQAQAEQETAAESGYRDGTYEGSAFGFGDEITVSVTIADGKLTDISVLSADGEDKPYYTQSLPVLDKILSAQSTDGIDTVSGATLTSEGLIGAVADALGKAAV